MKGFNRSGGFFESKTASAFGIHAECNQPISFVAPIRLYPVKISASLEQANNQFAVVIDGLQAKMLEGPAKAVHSILWLLKLRRRIILPGTVALGE